MKKSKIFAKAALAILVAATLLSFAGCGLSGRTYSSVNIPGSNVPYFSLTFKSGSKGTISVANATAPNDKKQAEQYKFTYKIVNKDKHTVNMSVFKSSGDIAWASESDFSGTSVSYMMRGGDQILLFSKNAKNDGLSGKAYSAGFLNKKKEFYGYTLVFENDENAKFTDSRKNNGKAIPASYKEDSDSGVFQFGFMDGEEFKFFNGAAGNDGIKFKTSLSSEVSLAPGAYNFSEFIAETYEKWNQRGKVYLASDDETNKRSVTEIKGFDEHGSENLYMSKYDDERKTSVKKAENIYDSEGRLLKEYPYVEGDLSVSIDYSYNADGSMKKTYTKINDHRNKIYPSETYNKDGKIIEKTEYDIWTNEKFTRKYTYNENGAPLTEFCYDKSGNINRTQDNTFYLYKNNPDGTKSVLKYTDYYTNYRGQCSKDISDYDKDGNLVYIYSNWDDFSPASGGLSEHWYTYEHDKKGNVTYKKTEYKGIYNDIGGPGDGYDVSKYEDYLNNSEIWGKPTISDSKEYNRPFSGTTEEWYEYDDKNNITYEKKSDKKNETNRSYESSPTTESFSTEEVWREYNDKGKFVYEKRVSTNSGRNEPFTSEKWYEYYEKGELAHIKSTDSWKNNNECWYLYAYYDDGTVKTDISLK